LLLLAVFVLAISLRAQPYGLSNGAPFTAYLNGQLPTTAPNPNAAYDVTVAYTNLVFNLPLYLCAYPGTNYMVVIEKNGVIRLFPNRQNAATAEVKTFLDLTGKVFTTSDCGMTCIAFHPQFGQPGSTNRDYVYVTYKWRPSPDLGANVDFSYYRLSRFTVPDGTMAVDTNSEVILLQQFDQQEWHDSGCLMFGQDGYLYFGVGDEGGANDQYNVTQIMNQRLMSGIFRIDVNQNPATSHAIRMQPFHHPNLPAGWPESYSTNYFVPNDNPFVNVAATNLEEFYVLGCRNPYRFSQDPANGRIWEGDVGQDTREEVNIIQPGRNYQWAYMEGIVAGPKVKPATVFGIEQPPLWDYPHANGDGCIIGGYVYHGTNFPGLQNKYICCDNVSGHVWAVASASGTNLDSVTQIATMPAGSVYGGTSSCGMDANGEVYFVKIGGVGAGQIFKLIPLVSPVPDPVTPLSSLGVFTNLASLAIAPGFHGYTVNTPLWSDGALKTRWLGVPNDGVHDTPAEQVVFSPTNEWKFPSGTVFVKHFELPLNDTNAALTQRIETRLIVMDQNGSAYGLTYKWRADGSDADLLTTGTNANYVITGAGGIQRTQTWTFPSRADCLVCHNPAAGFVLGVKTHQLNCPTTYPETGVTDNQLRALGHIGLLGTNFNEAQLGNYLKSFALTNTSASLEVRARSYLDANCSQCHRPGGVRANFDARFVTPLAQQQLIYGPVFAYLTDTNDRVIVPRDLTHSVAYSRVNRVGDDQMPPLARNLVDSNAVLVISNWIYSLAVAPGVTLATANASVSGAFTVQVSFTAPVTGLTPGSFSITNGLATALTGSNANYSLTVLPLKFGAVTVQLPAAAVQDGSGNPNYPSAPLAASYTLVPPGLLHRWSFSDTNDSIGGAGVTLVGSATITNGQLNIPGDNAFTSYGSVNLTNDFVTNTTMTIECWFTMNVLQNWTKVWMFGFDTTAGEPALSYINFTPVTGLGGNPPKVDFDTTGAYEINTTALPNPSMMTAGVQYHVVTIFDAAANTFSFYTNGVFADSASMGGYNLTNLNANIFRFGCGFYYADPDLNGSINELRIWNTAWNASNVMTSYQSGPDILPTPGYAAPALSSFTNITIYSNTTPGPISFTVTPGSAPLAGLTLSGTSSSQSLVPNSNIIFGGSGSNRTVTIMPVPNQNGTATIAISVNDGLSTVSQTFQLSVFVVTPNPVLLHRWTFNVDGTDSVGGRNATLVGAATISGGQLNIPGGIARSNCATVNLTNTFAANPSVTIETWFTVTQMQDWSKVWMFGYNTGSEPTLCNLSFTPRVGSAPNIPKIELDPPTAGEMNTLAGPGSPPLLTTNVQYHAVTVYDSANNLMSYYINGVFADSASMGGFNLTQLTINECYFGAPVFYSDPNLIGSINEMRIWNAPMSPAQIAQDFALGPDAVAPSTPQITVPPQSQSVIVGSNATFTVTATGTAPLAYQWQRAGTNLSGATTNILTLTNVTANSAGNYSVIISNSAGSVTSSVAVLSVILPPPQVPGLLHRWSFSDLTDSVGNANATLVGNAVLTNGQLQIPGDAAFTSYAAVYLSNDFTIYPSMSVECWFTMTALQNWSKVWMFGFNNAAGEPALTYIDFTPVTGGNYPKVDFDPSNTSELNTTATPNPAALAANVQYHVVTVFNAASNTMSFYTNGMLADSAAMGGYNLTNLNANVFRFGCGFYWPDPDFNGLINEIRIWNSALAPNVITQDFVAGPDALVPVITAQPQSQNILAGGSANFGVTVAGTTPFAYQWRLNGTNLSGATTATLAVPNAMPVNAGNYSVVITNAGGSVTSANAALTVTVSRPLISSYGAVAGPAFSIGGTGVVGQAYIFQATTNLASSNWTSLATNTPNANGVFQFVDTQFTNRPLRFYRITTP
jgi:glucose/arabinose dehydrogenase